MSWFDYILLALWSLGALATVSIIGKPREPVTPGHAVTLLVLYVLMVGGLLATRGVF